MQYTFIISLMVIILLVSPSLAPQTLADDGTYDATVTTESGSYTVPVEVEGGEVTHVDWPNGGHMSVTGADLNNGEASGFNSRGEAVNVEIDDPSYQQEDNDE